MVRQTEAGKQSVVECACGHLWTVTVDNLHQMVSKVDLCCWLLTT